MKVLKIDLDIKPPEKWIKEWLNQIRHTLTMRRGYDIEYIKDYESKKGYHVYIKLTKDVDDKTANFLQFLLGDDRTRVKINQWRIERGVKRWNKMFDRKIYRKKAKTIECWYCGNIIPIIGDIKEMVEDGKTSA